jgi:hypothetical protein
MSYFALYQYLTVNSCYLHNNRNLCSGQTESLNDLLGFPVGNSLRNEGTVAQLFSILFGKPFGHKRCFLPKEWLKDDLIIT